MNDVKIQNSYNQTLNVQQGKKLESQENFTALDKEKLKQDTVQLAHKSAEQVKENWLFRVMRNTFGIEDPKKALKSVGLTALTIAIGAPLGNKTVKLMADAGLKVDAKLLGEGALGKAYKGIAEFFGKAKDSVVGFFMKSKSVQEIADTIKNKKMKATVSLAKGTGQGFKTQFSYTVHDTIQALFFKQHKNVYGDLKKACGSKDNVIKFLEKTIKLSDDEIPEVTEILAKSLGEDKANKIIADIRTNNDNFNNTLKTLLGTKAKDFIDYFVSDRPDDMLKFSDDLTDAIAQNLLGKDKYSKEELNKVLQGLKDGKYGEVDLSFFKDVTMDREGLMGGWWPTNLVEKFVNLFKKDKNFKFGRGNLGDAIMKYNISAGNLADTKIGALVQKSLLIPTESITNFVCDNAGMNLFMTSMIMSLYNTVQDAPKEKKVATMADDFVGSIGTLAISTPMAFATTYGLASLKNLEGNTFVTKILKQFGKIFGMGLEVGKDGKVLSKANYLKEMGKKGGFFAGKAGGALRFVLSMFVFSGIFAKPIKAVVHKVFGKPYDPAQEKQKAELEQQKAEIEKHKNELVPGFNITYGQLEEKVKNNPQIIQRMQNDPIFAREMVQNPQKLLDLFDGKEVELKPNDKLLSPANQRIASGKLQNNTNLNANNLNATKAEKATNVASKDTATYIPSSVFNVNTTSFSQEQTQEYNAIMAKADKVLKNAEKYI